MFMDQRWKDLLNVAAVKPAYVDHNPEAKKSTAESVKKTEQEKPRKPQKAKVIVANLETAERVPKNCKFAGVLGCIGIHPLWMYWAFGDKAPEERNKIIGDNNMCTFCLLHSVDEICYTQDLRNQTNMPSSGV
jgi:hypothetical protein